MDKQINTNQTIAAKIISCSCLYRAIVIKATKLYPKNFMLNFNKKSATVPANGMLFSAIRQAFSVSCIANTDNIHHKPRLTRLSLQPPSPVSIVD